MAALGKPAGKSDPQNLTVNELVAAYSIESPQLRVGGSTPGNITPASFRLTSKASFVPPTPTAWG